MSVHTDTAEKLVISVQLPRFLLWVMGLPVGIVLLVGLFEVVSGSTTSGLMLIVIFGGFFGWAFLRISERADLVLDAQVGTVRLTRRTLTGTRVEAFALVDLDSAELSRNPRRGSGAIDLVFTNTRPATRIPLTGWGVSQGGMAPLAQKINDWLAQARAR
ncbi:hypothetical protein GCM10011363_45090 [Marivita lacus]|uniref:PH domain-containing protein n=1 Tax=Marivita lacus TaxID=1323742 RepID=A0ABQ1LIA9_9RHOB|nr:hypothetical protein [Marivita lacus]GGC23577.1 hypothetical protein GCM10011363_45090 [Marivita lacus]